jgi:dynein heavy chain
MFVRGLFSADLESLFIQSEEVRKELPEATQRFAGIDKAVRAVLREMANTMNCVACCTKSGLVEHLETQQSQLVLCEKVRVLRMLCCRCFCELLVFL